MNERIHENLSLENKLREALDKEEFVLHYQPKVDVENRGIVGVEALIRWQSPELGLVPPMKFIPLLEETGLILQVGSWALRRAALDHRALAVRGLKPNPTTRVRTMITLAQSFELKVVAEGVGSEGQANMLRLLGCDQMQGYLFSKPVPVEALIALLM